VDWRWKSLDDQDIDALCAMIHGSSDPNNNDSGDLNADGAVDLDDMDSMIGRTLGTAYGDADVDGDVDGADFDLWRLRDGYSGPGTGTWRGGDFDCDGDVDGTDFDLWRLRPTQIPGEAGAQSAATTGAAQSQSAPLTSDVAPDESGERRETSAAVAGASFGGAKSAADGSRARLVSAVDQAIAGTGMYRSRHLRRAPRASVA
jgi:hypothetical protein